MLESLFNKVAGIKLQVFLKKRFQHRCFPVNTAFFYRIPLVAALIAIWFSVSVRCFAKIYFSDYIKAGFYLVYIDFALQSNCGGLFLSQNMTMLSEYCLRL